MMKLTIGLLILLAAFSAGVIVWLCSAPLCQLSAEWCGRFHAWQDLIAGILAVLSALFAVFFAWRGVQRQVKVTANIPLTLKQQELDWEERKLDQIVEKLPMYESIAKPYKDFLEETEPLNVDQFRLKFIDFRVGRLLTPTVLGSMAVTCPLPGLRSELLNAERNVSLFNEYAKKLDTYGRSQSALQDSDRAEITRYRIETRSSASDVLVSIKRVRTSIRQDRKFITKSRNQLEEQKSQD